MRDEACARLVADPELREVRVWMHAKFQQGWSFRRLARILNEQGRFPCRGEAWSDPRVKSVLQTPYQVGARIVDGELVFGGSIEALVRMEVYEHTPDPPGAKGPGLAWEASRRAANRAPRVLRYPRQAALGAVCQQGRGALLPVRPIPHPLRAASRSQSRNW